ncbi:MAG: hypothetical protein WCA32_12865, partial [Chromatiaceae bacterium]
CSVVGGGTGGGVRVGFLWLVLGVGLLVCVGAAADTMAGRVVRTVDGDTLVLLVSGTGRSGSGSRG